jgi:hypothetical protein
MLNQQSKFLTFCTEIESLKQEFIDFSLPSLKSGIYSNLPSSEAVNKLEMINEALVNIKHTFRNVIETSNQSSLENGNLKESVKLTKNKSANSDSVSE